MTVALKPIRTRVAHAGWGGNRFFGRSVEEELFGPNTFWRGLLAAIGAQESLEDHIPLLEDLTGCNLLADPRIWPLKATRLAASFGSILPATCAGLVFMESAMIGPYSLEACARFLLELRVAVEGAADRDEAVRAVVLDKLARKERISGFGVPGREHDERIPPVLSAMRRHQIQPGVYWSLMSLVADVLKKEKGLGANIGSVVPAVLLDLGCSARQVGLLATIFFLSTFVANAVEGAEQKSETLKRLPSGCVRYVGLPPRKSPAASSQGLPTSSSVSHPFGTSPACRGPGR